MKIYDRKGSFIDKHWNRLLVLPTIIYLGIFAFGSFFLVLFLSFTDISFKGELAGFKFVGLENYAYMFRDSILHTSIKNTILFVSLAVTSEMLLGLGMALLLNQDIKGKRIYRSLFLIPMMTTPIIVGNIWKLMYNSEFGLINILLNQLGVVDKPIPFLGNPDIALFALVLVDVWEWTPFVMLILLAGLQALPSAPYEAAMIDGAGSWYIFRRITLPMLAPILLVAFLLRFMDALKIFDVFYITTFGGPGLSTEVIGLTIYKETFKRLNVGYAASITVLVLFVVIIISNLLFVVIRKVLKR